MRRKVNNLNKAPQKQSFMGISHPAPAVLSPRRFAALPFRRIVAATAPDNLKGMNKLPLDRVRWPLVALLASAATLGFAYYLEIVHNQAPCQMCWWQRYVYFTAGPVALAAIFLNWRGAGARLMTTFSILLALIFLIGFGIAAWHALFEWDIAPGPTGCSAVGAGALPEGGSLFDQLNKPQAIPSCKDPLWRLPDQKWGLSMAGLNAVWSLVLAALSFYSASQPPILADTANEPPVEA